MSQRLTISPCYPNVYNSCNPVLSDQSVKIDVVLTAFDVIKMCKKGDPAPDPGQDNEGIILNDKSSNIMNLHLLTITKTSVVFIVIVMIAFVL